MVLVKITPETKFYSPLKVGFLIVSLVFFMFILHGLLTLQWLGEWNYFVGSASFWVFITDISSAIGLIIRFVGSLVAVGAVLLFFVKKSFSTQTTYKFLKIVLIAEALYWFTFITSGIWGVTPILSMILNDASSQITGFWFTLQWIISLAIPCLFESIMLPIALFKIVFNLNPDKPQRELVKWSLIAGTIYIFVWWLNNANMWLYTVISEGTRYLTSYPANMISFIFTVFGLLALGIFSAHFTKKTIRKEKPEQLKLKTVGLIITIAGLYFLWNYFTGIIFGTELWSDWYAWFLGHNLDLWALSLSSIGLPLLLRKHS